MTDHDALLRAVLLDPADDTPRLVYADWLDENPGEVPCGRCQGYRKLARFGGAARRVRAEVGDCPNCSGTGSVCARRGGRAEFIRVQCEQAGRERDGRDRSECAWGWTCVCRSHVLIRRGRELLTDGNARRWFGVTTRYVRPHLLAAAPDGAATAYPCDVRRGFVAGVTLGQQDFLHHAAALFARHPITAVRLSDVEVEVGGSRVTWLPNKLLPPVGRRMVPVWGLSGGLDPRLTARWVALDPGPDDAAAKLSAACVRFGRDLAGLPPIRLKEETP